MSASAAQSFSRAARRRSGLSERSACRGTAEPSTRCARVRPSPSSSRLESEYDDKLLREKARAQSELEQATAVVEKKYPSPVAARRRVRERGSLPPSRQEHDDYVAHKRKTNSVGTVDDLTGHLKEILEEEQERRGAGELPDRCPIPTVRRKTFKELGTPTVQAKEIASRVQEYGAEELLERAESACACGSRRRARSTAWPGCTGPPPRRGPGRVPSAHRRPRQSYFAAAKVLGITYTTPRHNTSKKSDISSVGGR